jgi:hypothetical protein
MRRTQTAFCRAPASCSIEAQRVLPNIYWRFVQPGMMPMVKHQPELARLKALVRSKVKLGKANWAADDVRTTRERTLQSRRAFLKRVQALSPASLAEEMKRS